MILAPLQALFRKLLNLCRRWTNRPLLWLLKLFSILSPCMGLGNFGPRNSRSDKESNSYRLGDVQSLKGESCLNNRGGPSSLPTERAVVLASSIVPGTPPQAHTRQHARSMDSHASFPRSPTSTLHSPLHDDCDGDYLNSMPLTKIIESSILEECTLSAEPDPISASPARIQKKPRKTIAPSARPRYDRNVAIQSNNNGWVFGPLKTCDIYRSQDVPDWKYYVHPEGLPYYVLSHESRRFCYLTEAILSDASVLTEINAFIEDIELHAEEFDNLPNNVEVVLEIQDNWSYYMVDLQQRRVFWLDNFDFDEGLGEEFGVESDLHFRNLLDFEFWQHIHDFPNHRQPFLEMFSEAMGILNYWKIDSVTSADSTAPYDDSDLSSLVVSVKHLEGAVKSDNQASYAYATASIARIMGVIYNERHHNFFGSHGARLNVWQSVRGQIPKARSWLVKFLSPLLFYAPETHLSGLERLWVDGVIRDRRWKKYQYKLERDWESFVLTSTVLLNANVALLSIPIVLSDQNEGILWASPAAVTSQVSIVASIASIIVGLLLIRQIRISSKDVDITAADAIKYLSRRRHKQLGLETMAIQYSLPYALLMWGMVTFLTSIAISCFFDVDGTPNTIQRLIYSAVWLCAIPLILWTVVTGWETNNDTHWTQLLSATWWKTIIRIHWERPDKKKPWTWRVTRKSKGDIEAVPSVDVKESDTDTAAEDNAARQSIHSTTTPKAGNNRRWRVRVRNFGPVRRLTFRSFTG